MQSIHFLLDLALILLCTKVLSLVSKKFNLPQVIGAILGGLILGPAVLGVIKETEFIKDVSRLGVIVIMFGAGLNTSIDELKKTGKPSFVIALIGVLVPLAGGYFLTAAFNTPFIHNNEIHPNMVFLQNMFIGVILTATSISITVEALREMGKLNTTVGNTILAAAVIDDVLGIIALTLVTSFAGKYSSVASAASDTNVLIVLGKIIAFFILAGITSMLFNKLFEKYQERFHSDKRRFVIMSFVYCLLLSYVAEAYFGVADITGAFLAGLAISGTQKREYISQRIDTMGYIILTPMFFASIGIMVSLPSMNWIMLLFTVLLIIVSIITKVVGCGFAAKLFKFNNKESLQIGVGMVTRGEVALIVANKGAAMGLISEDFFGPIVIMVIVTAIITPVLLKLAFKDKRNKQQFN